LRSPSEFLAQTPTGSTAAAELLPTSELLLAQTPPPQVPPSADPSQIERQLEPPKPRQELPPPIEVPQREEPTAPAGAEQQKFLLKSLEITGATVYSTDRLQQFYIQKLYREISLKDLYDIANQITQLYRQDGYLLSRALVPEQTIQEGKVRIQVIEGYVEKVEFEGASDRHQKRLKGFGERITEDRPLNRRTLERHLLLANDLAGIRVQSVLSPGSTLGAAVLTAKVKYDEFDPFFDFNNRGTPEVGPLRLQAGLFLNSALGQGERWTFSGATTPEDINELAYGSGALTLPIGSDGVQVDISGSYTAVKPGGRLQDFDLFGDSATVSIATSYPIIRSRRQNLYVSGQFDFNDSRNISSFLPGATVTLSNDRIRALRAGIRYDQVDRTGQTIVSAQVSQGLDILGATTDGSFDEPLSRVDGSAVFTKFNFDAARQQFLPGRFSLLLTGTAQASLDSLLAGEQFRLGGVNFGSAFDPAQVLGDSGYGFRAELQRPIVYTAQKFRMITQPYIFADYGNVYRKSPTVVENKSDTLASAGIGVRHYVSDFLSAQLELAFPIERSDRRFDGDPRLFFRLQGQF
jgi:hemolysin activation/secretion protein